MAILRTNPVLLAINPKLKGGSMVKKYGISTEKEVRSD
jgi:hypothetical protein